MDIKQKRYLLFLIGCIGSRSLLTYLAYQNNKNILLITGAIGIGFIYIYFFGSDSADKQLEWAGDKMIWWNHLRIVHGSLYLLFTYLAYKGNTNAWKLLMLDTGIGLIAWLNHHKFL